MSDPCPFCSFEGSDFRHSHNWRCSQCEKDYSDWLRSAHAGAGSSTPSQKGRVEKEALFSFRKEISAEAEPVKSAQSLFLLVLLSMVLLSFAVDGVFDWVFLISALLIANYAWTMHRTGYAIGKHDVYHRDTTPFMFRVHFWGAIVAIGVFLYAWFE